VIIADTGFWLALANRGDRHHGAAAAALAKLREPLITTWPVMTETCHLLATRLGYVAHERFVESAARGAFTLFALQSGHLPRIRELLGKYRDLPMDLADASLVILAEELGSGRILSTDARDFGAYRWKQRKPFRNLLTLQR
jgi:predicted nucleic acid-binding protein